MQMLKDHGNLKGRHVIGELIYYVFDGVRFWDDAVFYTMIRWHVKNTNLYGIIVERDNTLIAPQLQKLLEKYAHYSQISKEMR